MTALISRGARLPHAILIHGTRGVGKLDLAERFARFLLCEAVGEGAAACGTCEGCRWFAAGSHPDFRRIEPEAIAPPTESEGEEDERASRKARPSAEIKIDQVRELAGFLHMGTHRGRRRVALVHPAEDMNVHAASALLKSLEEPVPGAVFLLVSHRPARLLPTIRSRCVPVAVPLPGREAARAWLAAQGVEDAARWLAYAGGAPLRALEYAQGERGEVRRKLLQAVERGELDALAAATDRDSLEMLVDVLQKFALERAFAAEGRGAKSQAWLAFARRMGRSRGLARHPLNPRLLAAELLAGMPQA